MSDIDPILEKLLAFRQARDWEQYHTPKDVAISLCLEAAEVLEHFQWRSEAEIKTYIAEHKNEIGEELADVFNWILLLSHDLGIDILQAARDKIDKNSEKYPLDQAKGRHDKYTVYQQPSS